MELGEKLRQARLEAGLSQRQLCGEDITRNMLSQIEHGSAKPSMKTLQVLASRLGKTVSYFLEEDAVVSPNQHLILEARQQFDDRDFSAALEILSQYRGPDTVFDREKALLWVLIHLALAEKALAEGRRIYALGLLEAADIPVSYCGDALSRRRLLLLGQLSREPVSALLPSMDEELLLRAQEALRAGNARKAAHLLEAMDRRDSPRWHFLRGDCDLNLREYRSAAGYFHEAEPAMPRETAPKLEECYRELQDYRRAYEYACLQK